MRLLSHIHSVTSLGFNFFIWKRELEHMYTKCQFLTQSQSFCWSRYSESIKYNGLQIHFSTWVPVMHYAVEAPWMQTAFLKWLSIHSTFLHNKFYVLFRALSITLPSHYRKYAIKLAYIFFLSLCIKSTYLHVFLPPLD